MLDDLIIRRCICIFYKDPWNLAYTKLVGAYGAHLATESDPILCRQSGDFTTEWGISAGVGGGIATFSAEPFSIWYTRGEQGMHGPIGHGGVIRQQ